MGQRAKYRNCMVRITKQTWALLQSKYHWCCGTTQAFSPSPFQVLETTAPSHWQRQIKQLHPGGKEGYSLDGGLNLGISLKLQRPFKGDGMVTDMESTFCGYRFPMGMLTSYLRRLPLRLEGPSSTVPKQELEVALRSQAACPVEWCMQCPPLWPCWGGPWVG